MHDPVTVRRRDAAQWTLDTFRRRKFKLGTNDCVRMTAAHLRQLGHKVKLPPAGSYASPASALKRLRERGYDTLAAALEAHGLKPIPPAAAIVGDVLRLPWLEEETGGEPLCGLAVALGNGRVVGFHQDLRGADVLQPLKILAAWRVPVK